MSGGNCPCRTVGSLDFNLNSGVSPDIFVSKERAEMINHFLFNSFWSPPPLPPLSVVKEIEIGGGSAKRQLQAINLVKDQNTWEQKCQNRIHLIIFPSSAANLFSLMLSDHLKDFTWYNETYFPSGINKQRLREIRWGRSSLMALSRINDERLFLLFSHQFPKHWGGTSRPLSLFPPAVAGNPSSLPVNFDGQHVKRKITSLEIQESLQWNLGPTVVLLIFLKE